MTSAAAERENRALEAASDFLVVRLSDVRTAISGLIQKLESDPHLNWHSFLDSYAVISGQINSLLKNVKHERTPMLKKYITMPIMLSPERDEELAKLTDQRVATFSHEIVPHYLRTKPEPEVESKHAAFENRATNLTQDSLAKMLTVLDKVTQLVLKKINIEREEMESRSGARNEIERTSSPEDTMELMSAISHGFNLIRPMSTMPLPSPSGQNAANNMAARGGPGPGPAPPAKAISSIKTNIKAATQVHPYQRN